MKDNHSTIAAKCLQDDSLFVSLAFDRSEFSSVSLANIPVVEAFDSLSLSIKKRPALLFKTNVIVDETQLGVSTLIFCNFLNNAVRIKANAANPRESR